MRHPCGARFKIPDIVVKFDFAAKDLALFTGSVKLSINVQSHQFFPAGVPEHAQECVIAIQ